MKDRLAGLPRKKKDVKKGTCLQGVPDKFSAGRNKAGNVALPTALERRSMPANTSFSAL